MLRNQPTPPRTVTTPVFRNQNQPANRCKHQDQASRTKCLKRQMMGLPSRDNPLITSQFKHAGVRTSRNICGSPDVCFRTSTSVSQAASPGHHDDMQESDDNTEVDIVSVPDSQHSPATSTPISSRLHSVGAHIPSKNVMVFQRGDAQSTSMDLGNSTGVCDTRTDVGRTPLPAGGSGLPKSNSQTKKVASVSQEVYTSGALVVSRSGQGSELTDSVLAQSTCAVRLSTSASTQGQSSDQGRRVAPSPVATAVSRTSHQTR